MRPLPDSAHHGRPAGFKRDIALLIGSKFVAFVVNYRCNYSRDRLTHRSHLYIHTGVVGDADGTGFRLPPRIVERFAKRLDGPSDRFRVQRFADRTQVAKS